MIPVAPQLEPASFDRIVRQKGLKWLARKGVDLDSPAPDGFEFNALWRNCLDDLYESYGRVCAYGGFYVEMVTGSPSVEHFVSKSKAPRLAYEWGNYRMVCSLLNGRKSDYEDVLDPFTLQPETFHLNLASGAIFPNPGLDTPARVAALATIMRLKLDDAECRRRRVEDFDGFLRDGLPADYLKRRSPFVWFEANRQGLL
jgi:hypothetical protein